MTDIDSGDNIRLLGRILGEVIAEQAGEAVFDLIERVRRTAVESRRQGHSPISDLGADLDGAEIADILHVVRAFGWLALLANTAADLP
ncbi:MAG: phosphoenolpyruvate carboxylase, partial [Ilumatobacteraceae bacterium]